MLPRKLVAALALATLTIGVAVGAAIGSVPATVPADGGRDQFLAGTLVPLIARARAAQAAQIAAAAAARSDASATTAGAGAQGTGAAHPRKPPARTPATPTPHAPDASETSPTSSPSESDSSTSPAGAPSSNSGKQKQEPTVPLKPPPITHVWVIMLSGQSFTTALAQRTSDPYLAHELLSKGTLLNGYKPVARSALANDISLLSGQAPNADTEADCPTYAEVQPPAVDAASGLASGVGCVYPKAAQTLADELATGGLTWKAYVEDMDAEAPGATCRHPTPGAADPTQGPGHAYLGFRNPFVYFDSLLEGGACAADDVDLSALPADLAAPAGPPSLSWIVPSACHDGAPTPCSGGAPAGLTSADAFLHRTVPPILASSAYRKGGLVLISFDAAPASARPSQPVGALLISPFVRPGARVAGAYDQLSLLASLERLFGIPRLGHAADATVKQLGDDVYLTTKKAA